ncbi:ankyrin repeat-containing domain protein [Mycena olivaceomarginata]|nr:ankyrin repeat-containing domain protein [Mycena olivaceomarginata]
MANIVERPTELILLLPPLLRTSTLNALAQTCGRLWEILHRDLELRLTPALGRSLMLWAAKSRPHIIRKLIFAPHSIDPDDGYWRWTQRPLHIAVQAGNIEIASLLLEAGADPSAERDTADHRPIHLAAMNDDLEMMKLLLVHGARVDDQFFRDGNKSSALHYACAEGKLEMIELLLQRGANLECRGHYGSALGFAVHSRRLDVVKLLLAKGAAPAPLFYNFYGWCPSGWYNEKFLKPRRTHV